MNYQSTKIIELGSCAFRQWRADSHCKFVHGYRLQAKFWFDCSSLDDKNWVVDFGGLKGLKAILEKQFDHTLCIAGDDPLLSSFRELHRLGAVDLRVMANGVGIERMAEWCLIEADRYIRDLTNNRCWVDRVEVWEHEKNSAIYSASKCCTKDQSSKHVAQQFEFNFKDQSTNTAPLEQAPIANTVAAPAPEIQKAVNSGPISAPVGNKVTTGLSNPFGGTSWGV